MTFKDAHARLCSMASGSKTWDLSKNDIQALKLITDALVCYERLHTEVVEFCQKFERGSDCLCPGDLAHIEGALEAISLVGVDQ